jgi:hypothetical protein
MSKTRFKMSFVSEEILCKLKQQWIECELPITKPTSKARVKRRGIDPIATRKTEITSEDYVEWQISYQSKDKSPIELGIMVRLAYDNGMISKEELCRVVKNYGDPKIRPFDEENRITREIQQQTYMDFQVMFEKTPILRYNLGDGCYIEVALRHKQKAVGYQSMVFIYIPVKNLHADRPLIGRRAYTNEAVLWRPSKDHIFGLLKAFLIASNSHRNDVKRLIQKIIGDCEL